MAGLTISLSCAPVTELRLRVFYPHPSTSAELGALGPALVGRLVIKPMWSGLTLRRIVSQWEGAEQELALVVGLREPVAPVLCR